MGYLIDWFVDNRVATNLLMWILLIGGVMAYPEIRKEEFPNFEANAVSVVVPYPGASPEEVEQTVCIRVEEVIEGVLGIKHVNSTAAENACTLMVELETGYDRAKAQGDIKAKVDAIDTFPVDADKPVVAEVSIINNVLQLVLSGKADERSLKEIGEKIREDILAKDGVSYVVLDYVRPYEISIELSEHALRKYALNLAQVANIVRAHSIDLPGGAVKTSDGEIIIRTIAQAESVTDFERIPLVSRDDGTTLYLGDVATVIDGFQETDLQVRFDGERAVVVEIKRIGNENVLEVARIVKSYVQELQQTLPEGVNVTIWRDESQDLVDRLGTMGSNAVGGLILVLLILTLFLQFRLAFWVAAGIPIAMFGTIMAFPWVDLSISTVSVMGIILVLGILVDDAIVVGERIFAHQEMGKSPRRAAIDGTKEVSLPVIFGVLTTMTAFMPIMSIKSSMGPLFAGVGLTAILAMVFSIIESQLILPMHLSHGPREPSRPWPKVIQRWLNIQQRFSDFLSGVASNRYVPMLLKAMRWRYFVAALAVSVMIVMLGILASGRIGFQFFPAMDGTRLYANLTMTAGTPIETTERATAQLERAAATLSEELNETLGRDDVVKHVMVSIGKSAGRGSTGSGGEGGSHTAEITVELNLPPAYDGPATSTFAARWRELTGPVAGAVDLSFTAVVFSAGGAIDVQLRGDDLDELKVAAALLKDALAGYQGVFDIGDSFRAGKREVRMELLPEAQSLGITAQDLARQVRQAFYGEEVQRLARGREDIKVMLRFPLNERKSLGDLENMRIRTASGDEVPFTTVAKVDYVPGLSSISRVDGKRTINVLADVDRNVTSPEEVLGSLEKNAIAAIEQNFPGIEFAMSGEQEESADSMGELTDAAKLAVIIIYALLAIPLKSYAQPLVIMSVIPFGAVGAIVGHMILGYDLMFFSLLGIMALAGVVINSSLVLVDSVNQQRSSGEALHEIVARAGGARFRPIVLTSLTTFVGLLPMISITSLSTFIFVPLAISLAFGVLFATVVTLFLVPCYYLILEDAKIFLGSGRAAARQRVSDAFKKVDQIG